MNRRSFMTRTLGAGAAGAIGAIVLPAHLGAEPEPAPAPVTPGLDGWVVLIDERDAIVARVRSRFVVSHLGENTNLSAAESVTFTPPRAGVFRVGFLLGALLEPLVLYGEYSVISGVDTITIYP